MFRPGSLAIRWLFACVPFVVVTVMVTVALNAQAPPKEKEKQKRPGGASSSAGGFPGMNMADAKPMDAKGKINDVDGNGVMKVLGAGGAVWFVRLAPMIKEVSYTASAEPSWLQPGMLVRFSAKVDKKGKITEPLTQLKVMSPREHVEPGILAEGGADGGAELFNSSDDKKPKKKKKNDALGEAASYTVTGQLTSLKNGKFAVSAAGATVTGELGEKAKVEVDLNDFSLVRQGDAIEFRGAGMKVEDASYVIAHHVTVSAQEPLTGESGSPKKKPTIKPELKKATKAGT